MASCSNSANDGWITVDKGHKRCADRKGVRKLVANLPRSLVDNGRTYDLLRKWSTEFVDRVGEDVFSKSFLSVFPTLLQSKDQSDRLNGARTLDIIVYGLGNFDHRWSSLIQLAFVMNTKNRLSASHSVRVLAYDPVFEPQERNWLIENGVVLIDKNERCLRTASTTTLFYLPHCGRSLYNNVLCANWAPKLLRSVVILGNRFSDMISGYSKLKGDYKYLAAASEICAEVRLLSSTTDGCNESFMDQSLHYFSDTVMSLPFEKDPEAPSYDRDKETELIVDDNLADLSIC